MKMTAHLPVCAHGTLVGLPSAGRAIIFVYARVTHALEDGEVNVGGVRHSDHSEIAYDRKGCAKSHFQAKVLKALDVLRVLGRSRYIAADCEVTGAGYTSSAPGTCAPSLAEECSGTEGKFWGVWDGRKTDKLCPFSSCPNPCSPPNSWSKGSASPGCRGGDRLACSSTSQQLYGLGPCRALPPHRERRSRSSCARCASSFVSLRCFRPGVHQRKSIQSGGHRIVFMIRSTVGASIEMNISIERERGR